MTTCAKTPHINRRQFVKTGVALTAAAAAGGCATQNTQTYNFDISLAQWSLHRMLQSGELDNLDFPAYTKATFDISAVEYVNQFFFDKAQNTQYLSKLRQACSDHGVKSALIMCDGEGELGNPDNAQRKLAVENHYKWLEAAKYLGCHSIRVNAKSEGQYEEQKKLCIDGLQNLSEYGKNVGVNVIVENHGGLSSNGKWLREVISGVAMDNCGTLPDFGNFGDYDRYQGVKDLMPFAKGVSAKSHEFDSEGNEVRTNFKKMLEIVSNGGYSGYIGVEYEGDKHSELEGIKLTKTLLEKYRSQ